MLLLLLINYFPFAQERLSYNLFLGPLRVGELKLACEKDTWDSGALAQSVYRLSATLRSNFLFAINDSLSAISRQEDFTTLKSYKRVKEDRYQKEIGYEFKGDRIEYSDGTTIPCLNPPKDLLSLWYYFRHPFSVPSETLAKDQPLETSAHFDKKDYRVQIKVKGRVKVITPIGTFLARRLQPETCPKSILGDVYLSEDSLNIPLVIKTKLLLGMVKAIIREREAE